MRHLQRLWIVSVVSLLSAPTLAAPPEATPDGRSQQQSGTTQSQVAPVAPAPGPYGPPTIEVNPQIQVQVNPDVDVEAKPTADADANANANTNVQANPEVDAKAEIANETATAPQVAPPPAPPPVAAAPTRVQIVQRPVPPPAARRDQPQRRSGLMIAGVFTFGGTYIGTALNGAALYEHCDRAADSGACRQIATKMLIPVVGPFSAIDDSQVRTNQVKLGLLGGLQAAGAAMAVVGAWMHIKDGRNSRFDAQGMRVGKRTRVAPMAGTGGGGFAVNLRF
jgi:hypothetical protein